MTTRTNLIAEGALVAAVLCGGAAPCIAQIGDFDGTFVVKKPAAGVMPDTVLSHDSRLTWIRHDGKSRTTWEGDYASLETEVGIESGDIKFARPGAPPMQVFVSAEGDDEGNYWWEFVLGDGAAKQRLRFDHPTKPVDPDDLKPRARQPPVAFGDSVVLSVRALYQRINGFPCIPPPEKGESPHMFQVCALGKWTGRINMHYMFEATRIERSFTWDSTGALRFALEVIDQPGFRSPQHHESRYYFALGHLVRWTGAKNGGAAKKWDVSEERWREVEAEELKEAAACLAASGAVLQTWAADSVIEMPEGACRY